MDDFSYNSQYLIRNGKPWFPLMGEMHYSRVDRRFWADSLQKMKAGGIDIVSSYVIWIHHESRVRSSGKNKVRDLGTIG